MSSVTGSAGKNEALHLQPLRSPRLLTPVPERFASVFWGEDFTSKNQLDACSQRDNSNTSVPFAGGNDQLK
jgi:hypothetical protein